MIRTPRRRSTPERTGFELQIERVSPDGLGIGRHQGKEVLVAGALAGERVLAGIEHEGQRRIVGRLLKVLSRHPDRVPSACRLSRSCQGCPLIHLAYPAQLAWKEAQVREALSAYPNLSGVRLQPIWAAADPFGYRTSAKLVFGRRRGEVQLGLYRRGSHEVVDIGDCPVHHPLINRIAAVVREEVQRQGIYVYHPERRTGLLRYLAVRVSPASGRALVTVVTAERNFREINNLAKWLQRKVPEIAGVHQNVNASEGNVVFGRETLKMTGVPDLRDQVGEVRLLLAPTTFFQVNHAQAARIYTLVRHWAGLDRRESAVDLYCGIGGIALHLGLDAGRVTGIELSEDAVRSARANARLNGLENCRFLAGDAAELVEDLALEEGGSSVAVVNPPRGGCGEAVLQALAALAPRRILYVSCNPETLARDLDLLGRLGYPTAEIQPVDMFPQTPHVESVARLEAAGGSGAATSAPTRPGAGGPGRHRGSRGTAQRSGGKAPPRGHD